jgi:hypothetical protein
MLRVLKKLFLFYFGTLDSQLIIDKKVYNELWYGKLDF